MSSCDSTLEKIKEQLRLSKSIDSSVKSDLYSHMTEVFNRIMLHHQYDAFDKLEEISRLVKETHLKVKDPQYDHQVNQIKAQKQNSALETWLDRSKSLLKEHWDAIPQAEKSLLSKNKKIVMPNFVEEAAMLEWAGVYFGEEEAFKVQKSVKKLAVMSGASVLRVWGKIWGTEKDYLIVEGVLNRQEEKPVDATQEPRGEGCNRFVYWVTDNVLNDWI